MSSLNPVYRSADEVVVPDNLKDHCGWTDGKTDLKDALQLEQKAFGSLEKAMPFGFRTREAKEFAPEILEKWNAFQESKGRYAGSMDWSLLDEFALQKQIDFLPQIIGSCVQSNSFRPWVDRSLIQIVMYGSLQEYLGRDEFGVQNIAPYGPWSYGCMRRRGGLRSGDGGFCAPMAESYMKDGVLLCNTPQLVDLLKRLGVAGERDFPEPQGNDGKQVYRRFGNWEFLDQLKPYATCQLLESPRVTSAGQLWDLLGVGKTAFVCSGEAIHKVGTHRDGFAIHARNPRDTWYHNIGINGRMVASDGERFFRWCNKSWGPSNTYNRQYDEVDRRIRTGELTIQAIGEIDLPKSAPPPMPAVA